MDASGILVATCLSAALGCFLCAFFSNKPFAMASGMGMNAFFAYTLCGRCGYTWQQALALTVIAGVIFLLLVLSPLREKIIAAIPANLKYAISAGIGLFLTVIGLLDTGIITMTQGYPALGDLHDASVQIALAGLAITAVLLVCKVKGSLILGMAATVLLSLLCGQTALPQQVIGAPSTIGRVFCKLDFTGLLRGDGLSGMAALAALLLSMTMVDLFDTLGFLIGTGARAGLLEEDGSLPGTGRVLIADASATVLGALCGTSTVTCYAESAAGIAAGGRTGLTALTVGICFLLAAFFSPLAGIMTAAATAPAMIIVGMYLLMEIKRVDFSQMDDAIPAFATIVTMPFAYSITTGIAAGFLSYVLCKLAARKWRALNVPVVLLALVFLLYLCL